MKTFIKVVSILFLFATFLAAQENEITEAKFKVFGNCSMCKTRIEKAAKIKGVKFAKWDKKEKILTVAFLSQSVSVDSLHKRIAAVGHDTEKYKAPDDVYKALPACCLYRANPTTH
ncbi:MAG: ATPase [bacterium]